jgi:hypothetical protein
MIQRKRNSLGLERSNTRLDLVSSPAIQLALVAVLLRIINHRDERPRTPNAVLELEYHLRFDTTGPLSSTGVASYPPRTC